MKRLFTVFLICAIALCAFGETKNVSECNNSIEKPCECALKTTYYDNYSDANGKNTFFWQLRRGGSKLDMAKGMIVMTAFYAIVNLSLKS